MLNKVFLIGRLGRDPELKYTQAQKAVAVFNLATDEGQDKSTGQKKVEWHRVKVFDRQAEQCSQSLRKGSLCSIEGRLSTNRWKDQQGQEHAVVEIVASRVVFLDPKPQGAPQAQPVQQQFAPPQQAQQPKPDIPGWTTPPVDDLPF